MGSFEEVRAARLRSRSTEIEEAILARIRNVASDQAGSGDAQYEHGQRAAVAAVLDYALTGIEHGEERAGPIPAIAVAQARRAARNGVGLETILLRYAAGHRLLVDFLMAEADDAPAEVLRQVLGMLGLLLERLLAGISAEHKGEVEWAGRSLEQRRTALVRRRLAGEPVDTAGLGYEFDAWHLGVIATGVGARGALRSLATGADRQLLPVSNGDNTEWAWLGGQRRLAVVDILRLLQGKALAGIAWAVGEPGKGIPGFCLTHDQAQAALLVALERPRRLTLYSREMLRAPALRDQTLARSLEQMFLLPLASQRDGGAVSRETLREYFNARRNAALAGKRLGISRSTVEQRLRTVERVIGRPLSACLTELEVALRLQELGGLQGSEKLPPRD